MNNPDRVFRVEYHSANGMTVFAQEREESRAHVEGLRAMRAGNKQVDIALVVGGEIQERFVPDPMKAAASMNYWELVDFELATPRRKAVSMIEEIKRGDGDLIPLEEIAEVRDECALLSKAFHENGVWNAAAKWERRKDFLNGYLAQEAPAEIGDEDERIQYELAIPEGDETVYITVDPQDINHISPAPTKSRKVGVQVMSVHLTGGRMVYVMDIEAVG